MSNKIDTHAVKSARSIDDVIGDCIELKKNGNEYEACCPFHEEKTPSFRVVPDKDFYYCFGCGANGDAINFVMDYSGASFKEACEVIAGSMDITAAEVPKKQSQRIDYYEQYSPIVLPADTELPAVGSKFKAINPKRDHKLSTFKPTYVWPYRQADGGIVGMVIRIEIDGKKITPTIRWCQYGDKQGWVMYPLPEENRPMYNLTGLMNYPDKQVVVVEGEKAAQVLQEVVGKKLVVVSWAGGTKVVKRTDWAPLTGRSVILIPDADEQGHDAMSEVMGFCVANHAASIKVVLPEEERPKGWDVADEQWGSAEKFIAWARSRIGSLPSHKMEESPEPEYIPPEEDECTLAEQDEYYNAPPEPEQKDFEAPYRMLGYNGEYFYFLPHGSQQIKALTATALGQSANLLTLAPLDHWKISSGISEADKMKPEHWQMHVNGIVQRSYDIGVFDLARIRGRGAWIDKGRNILHVGNKVYIDGEAVPPETVQSRYLYPRDLDMDVQYVRPASNASSHELVKICERLSWERSLSGALLAGWCVIAPLCGMLDWRPHIWVTGPSGAGKSTVLNDIIGVMLGHVGVKVEGKTTEAGIRQMLGTDARPILFDEAEAEDESSARRMQGILDFARVSSSGGKIIKGTTGGRSMEFVARSAFCFSSINTTVKHLADEARITKLVLHRDNSKSDGYWEQLERDLNNLITEDYANSMLSRSIYYMGTIKANIDVFIRAATSVFKSRRIADQIGTMLAGTYLCYSTNVIGYDKAKEWIERFDWSEHTIVSAKSDPERLLELVATRRVRIVSAHTTHDITLGEAIIITSGIDLMHPQGQLKEECEAELRRFGIKVDRTAVTIANSCQPMAKMLSGTPWESSWSRTLSEIDGAEKVDTQHFSPGIKSRAVKVPLKMIAS